MWSVPIRDGHADLFANAHQMCIYAHVMRISTYNAKKIFPFFTYKLTLKLCFSFVFIDINQQKRFESQLEIEYFRQILDWRRGFFNKYLHLADAVDVHQDFTCASCTYICICTYIRMKRMDPQPHAHP